MMKANVETKDIRLQKSHLHIQVTWMGKHEKMLVPVLGFECLLILSLKWS